MIGSMYTLYFGYNPYSPYCSRSFMKWLPMRDAVSCNWTTEEMQEKISGICADTRTGSYIQECLPADITALILLHFTALTLPCTTALTLPHTKALITPHYSSNTAVHYSSNTAAHYSTNSATHYSSNTATHYSSNTATHYSSNTATHYSSNTAVHVCHITDLQTRGRWCPINIYSLTRKGNVLKYAKGQQPQSTKIHVCKRMN